MTLDPLLRRLKSQNTPSQEVQGRIQKRIASRIGAPQLFADLKKEVSPRQELQQTVWSRIQKSLLPAASASFAGLKEQVTPSRSLQRDLRAQVLERLTTAPSFGVRAVQWAAAFALVALVVRASPLLFIATPSIADSEAILLPTGGEVSLSVGGLWQPLTEEIALEPGMLLRTGDTGEVSLLLRDDGVIRLDRHTTVEVLDISDRLEPAPDVLPTISLVTGRIWVQGLIPTRLRGITVATANGHVTVNEGSVSIAETETIDVEVYDRRAVVMRNDDFIPLTVGERVNIAETAPILVKNIQQSEFQKPWPVQNLQRDAVHRHEIAQLQHERRISQAGILPTSRLYSVKRIAERVDVLLTFNQEARMQKKLQQAETRLNEAAALIAGGANEDASITLDEYRSTLVSIMSGSGDTSLAQFMVQQSMAETTAEMSAAVPGDEGYILKKAVLVASSELPHTTISLDDTQADLLVDGLAAINRKIYDGDTSDVEVIWSELQPYVNVFESGSVLRPDVYKEARALLTFFAESVTDASAQGETVNPELLADISEFLPEEEELEPATLSEEELQQTVQAIRDRIFVYNMAQSRINQLVLEFKNLEGNPDQGRILRRLEDALPSGPENFPDRVYKEIIRLRWEKVGEL